MSNFHFTYANLEEEYKKVIAKGYEFLTCHNYYLRKKEGKLPPLMAINRVDIDLSVKKAGRLIDIYNRLAIKATFFLRLHAPEYNPFSFENYRIIKHLVSSGHELGYHSEIVDQSKIWDEDAAACLQRDIDVMERIFNIKIKGVASHGGITGYNNLDFWKDQKPATHGIAYEAYDHEPEFNLFQESRYVSDSEWVRWKSYDNAVRRDGDNRPPSEHAAEGIPVLCLLVHPDTYFDHNFYDNEK